MSNRAVLTEGLRLREPECERRPPAKQMTPVSTVLLQQLIIYSLLLTKIKLVFFKLIYS